jgi:hypothetical protein
MEMSWHVLFGMNQSLPQEQLDPKFCDSGCGSAQSNSLADEARAAVIRALGPEAAAATGLI